MASPAANQNQNQNRDSCIIILLAILALKSGLEIVESSELRILVARDRGLSILGEDSSVKATAS